MKPHQRTTLIAIASFVAGALVAKSIMAYWN